MYKSTCDAQKAAVPTDSAPTESLEAWMVDSASNGACTQTTVAGKASRITNGIIEDIPTVPSPFTLSSVGAQSSVWTSPIPGGVFSNYGAVSYYTKPTKEQDASSDGSLSSKDKQELELGDVELKFPEQISLKVLGANAK